MPWWDADVNGSSDIRYSAASTPLGFKRGLWTRVWAAVSSASQLKTCVRNFALATLRSRRWRNPTVMVVYIPYTCYKYSDDRFLLAICLLPLHWVRVPCRSDWGNVFWTEMARSLSWLPSRCCFHWVLRVQRITTVRSGWWQAAEVRCRCVCRLLQHFMSQGPIKLPIPVYVQELQSISFRFIVNCMYECVTCSSDYRRGLDWWIDLLTSNTINSYWQAIQRYRWFTQFTDHRCTHTRILSLH
jgi:hypothetical protein